MKSREIISECVNIQVLNNTSKNGLNIKNECVLSECLNSVYDE